MPASISFQRVNESPGVSLNADPESACLGLELDVALLKGSQVMPRRWPMGLLAKAVGLLPSCQDKPMGRQDLDVKSRLQLASQKGALAKWLRG